MTRDWESTFRGWMGSASDTEKARREHAESMIRDAIANDATLSKRNLKVFAQGSYRNNTNVPQDSDVDICVCLMDAVYTDFAQSGGYTRDDVGLTDSAITYAGFKAEVGRALQARFGTAGVSRGNKAFDVHANSYRIDADVVAALEHRRYQPRAGSTAFPYLSGCEFHPDNGGTVVNWPQQQYDNGVAKNKTTGGRFKGLTRVLKELKYEMATAGIAAANPIPSFLVECLVYNASDSSFGHAAPKDDLRSVLAQTFNGTLTDGTCNNWLEVSGLKWLFRTAQPWTRQQAHAFLSAAWDYVGFG